MVKGQIHIAVIDNGISEELIGIHLYEDVLIKDKTLYKQDKGKKNKITHGTVCAGIIMNYAADSIMSSICVLEKDGKGNIGSLLAALHWCMENQVDIINVSIGSHYFRDKDIIKPVIAECVKKGIIPVCAADNEGVVTYPASLGNVIGVKSDNTGCLKAGEWMGIEDKYQFDGIEIAACSRHSFELSSGEIIECNGANSFAAPLITGILAKRMEEGKIRNAGDAKRWLAGNGRYPRDSFNTYNNIEWMERIACLQIRPAVHKFNKHSMIFDTELQDAVKEMEINRNVSLMLRNGTDAVCLFYDSKLTADQKLNCIYRLKNEKIVFFDMGNEKSYYFGLDNRKHFLYDLDYSILAEGERWELSAPVISITGRQEDIVLISGILWEHFEPEGYSVLICCDFIIGVLNGAVFIKREDIDNNVLAKLSYIRMADIIIILSKKKLRRECIDVSIDCQNKPDGFEADLISGQQRTFIKNENISIVTEQIIEELDRLCNS